MERAFFRIEHQDGVATVSLTQLTMPPAFFEEVGAVFRALGEDDGLRAVVLRSEARVFTYGLDLKQVFKEQGPLFMGKGLARPRTELLGLIRRWQGHLEAVAACPVPVIAAIHGHCIGGGLDLVSAADIRLATADAEISLREARLGIVADLGSLQRVPRIVGPGHAAELAFTGKDIDATRALRIGLVNEVYPDRDTLFAAADAMAREIAANPPLTVRGIKDVMRYGADKPVADGLGYVAAWNAAFVQSLDLAEALSAFLAKRPPNFKGE